MTPTPPRAAVPAQLDALRLAVELELRYPLGHVANQAATELRHLHAENRVLKGANDNFALAQDRYTAQLAAQPASPVAQAGLRQILLDKENQPNQYGVQFLMHGPKMAFKIDGRHFTLDYEPDEPGEFEFMRDALIDAFAVFTPDVKNASHAKTEHIPAVVLENRAESNMGMVPLVAIPEHAEWFARQKARVTMTTEEASMLEGWTRLAWRGAMRASHGQAPAGATTYVAAHECHNCGHAGINDDHATDAACNSCGWNGPSPKEDHCPGCGQDGTMTSACPMCSGVYVLVAEAHIPATTAQAAPAAGAVAGPSLQHLHNLLYEAQRSTGAMQAEVITDARIVLSKLMAAAPTPAAQADSGATDEKWCAYVSGVICTYLHEDAEGAKAKAIAGIMSRRLMFLNRPKAQQALDASPSAASIAWNALRDATDPLGEAGTRIMGHVRIYAQRQYEAGLAEGRADSGVQEDAARYRTLRDPSNQLHEDDISVADSSFTTYFGADLDREVDKLAERAALAAKGQKP